MHVNPFNPIDDHVMEEMAEKDFSILATDANDQDWTEEEILGFEPEASTELVELDEVDQLAETFASSKV